MVVPSSSREAMSLTVPSTFQGMICAPWFWIVCEVSAVVGEEGLSWPLGQSIGEMILRRKHRKFLLALTQRVSLRYRMEL